MERDYFKEQNQLISDQRAILSALKTEISKLGDHPRPHQHKAVTSCEQWLISKSSFLGLSDGQMSYLNHYMDTIERAFK